MSGHAIRRGGRAALPSGGLIVWSVADGRRGRRWREVTSVDGTVVRVVLLESDPAGRLGRLEMATAAGLLTLHPDRAATALHGNVVTPTGVRHLTFDRMTLLVDGSPAAAAIAVAGLAEGVPVGGTAQVDLVRVDDRLQPRTETWSIDRIEPRVWRLVELPDDGSGGGPGSEVRPGVRREARPGPGVGAEERIVRVDEDGLPELPGDTWPLEV
jgi:hypothetical protein